MAKRRYSGKSKRSEDSNVREDRRESRKSGDSNQSYACRADRRMDGLNDLSWYTRNPLLVEAAGRFPYPYKPGMVVPKDFTFPGSATEPQTFPYAIPGVLALDWAPSVGYARQASDPINVVAKEIFARVRNAYSGTLEADPQDFVVYLMALDSVFSYLAYLKRIYRTVSMYSSENFTFPDTLMRAYGFDMQAAQSLRDNKVKLWQRINELVFLSRKLTCPAIMDVFNRHYWLSDNVYADAASLKSQFYIFNLRGVYQYTQLPVQGSASVKAGGLSMVAVPHQATSGADIVDTLYNFGLTLFNALSDDEDSYIINGYLQRAYEGVPNFVVQELMQDEALDPVYVPEVLMQIENSTPLPGFASWDGEADNFTNYTGLGRYANVVNQIGGTGNLNCQLYYQQPLPVTGKTPPVSGDMLPVDVTISLRSDMPTVADNIIASRLMAVAIEESVDAGGGYNFTCGTEIPFGWRMVSGFTTNTWASNAGPESRPLDTLQWNTASAPTKEHATAVAGMFYLYAQLAAWDWHPLYDTIINMKWTPMGDVHNITVLKADQMRQLHRMCTYSEFNAFAL